LEASSFCQLRCPSCPTATGAANAAVGGGFLRFDDFRKFVEINPFVRQIEISNYGEIFLNPQLVPILEYACGKDIAITIENGVNLNHAKDEALEALVKHRVRIVTCSIDGASPETYRIYRVRGDFDAVMENVAKINAYKQQYRSDHPHLVWQFVVFGHNEHEIPRAREMANSLGMEFRTKLTWDSEFSPIRDKDFVRAQINQQSVTRDEFEREHGDKYGSGICRQLWKDPQINWDGKILGCCRNFWGDFGGNALTDGLAESLNNEKIAYARGMLTGVKPPRDDIPCTTCEMYQAMVDRSRFIPSTEVERETGGETWANDTFRRIQTFIGEIDSKLLNADQTDVEAYRERMAALKQSMIEPSFLIGADAGAAHSSPAVSVVMPTFNRARVLGEAIESVQAQSFSDWELIVVDDGSNDRTAEAVAKYLVDPRIRFISRLHAGHSAARNHALGSASGTLVAYLDSDNIWFPHFLKAAVLSLQAVPAADCIYGALCSDVHLESPRTILFDRFDRARLLRENYIDLNTFVHRRSLLDVHGSFDEALNRLVDWDLVLRLTRDKPAFRVPILAVQYRVVDDQRVTVTSPLESNYQAIRRKWHNDVRASRTSPTGIENSIPGQP
jgi:MoaA/NifB/PqqE/SkfB family radical SAM enzyme